MHTSYKYIIILQCHIVKERCSGFLCEKAYYNRKDLFAAYKSEENLRMISFTCGGCCGRATLRKLENFLKCLNKSTDIKSSEIRLHFSSCICKESYHGSVCPHFDYLKTLVERKNIKYIEGTTISQKAALRRDNNEKWHK
jgi:predicted metal-binding protein